MICFELLAIGVVIAGCNDMVRDEITVIAAFASFLGFFVCLLTSVVGTNCGLSAEKSIESKLSAALGKSGPPEN